MASKSTARLIKVAFTAGKIELAVKLCMLANIENGGGVFIDNALGDARDAGMNAHQFAGGLGALTVKGFYQASTDPEYTGLYGYVNADAA